MRIPLSLLEGRRGGGRNYDIMKTDAKGQVEGNIEIITLLNIVFYEICLKYLRLHYWWVVGGGRGAGEGVIDNIL